LPRIYWSKKGWKSPQPTTMTQESSAGDGPDPPIEDMEGDTEGNTHPWDTEDEVGWEEDLLKQPEDKAQEVPENPYKKFPPRYNLRVLSWNIAGLNSPDRMKALRKVIRKFKPDVILLQEIHGDSAPGKANLRMYCPDYSWSLNWGPRQKRGVAIGIRNNPCTPFPLPEAVSDPEGNFIALDFTMRGRDCRAISIYRPSKTPWEQILSPYWDLLQTGRDMVVAGDFNHDKSSDEFPNLEGALNGKGLTRLEWDSPTHWKGGNIDHVFVSNSVPIERRAITAVPTLFKDHVMLVGGALGMTINTSTHAHRLPEYAVQDPAFQREVLERAGVYTDCPMQYLQDFKTRAWEVWEEWKAKSDVSRRYRRLWDLQVLRGALAQGTCLPKPKYFSPLLEEITEATLRKYNIKKGKPWRRIIHPRVIATCDEWIEFWEGQLGIPTPSKFLRGKKRAARAQVKGILVREGVVIRNKEEVAKRVTKFWGNLFGTVRDYDPAILDRLIEEHGGKFDKVPPRVVTIKEVMALLTRRNKSCAGPDGIPFSLFKSTASILAPMWRDLIQEAGSKTKWPSKFFDSQLVLLPKVESGFPETGQFRPICITNADYRIVTRYWALWLAELANGVVSKTQHALLPGRRIDDAIEIIHDGFMEAVVDGKKATLLQTDFYKAYDYVNREALCSTLKQMGAPEQILNLAGKIMAPSTLLMPRIGLPLQEECTIVSRTGVKQGCPISPLLYIIIYDLLVVSLSKSEEVDNVEAYMDDLSLLMGAPELIEGTTGVFRDFCTATGALLNFKKCFILTQDEDFSPSGEWGTMEEKNYRSNETVYLGVPISRVINPAKEWKGVLSKMSRAANRIKLLHLRGAAKIQAVNTFVIPIMSYMGRFKIINIEVARKMWKIIRSALGSQASAPVRLLSGEAAPFDQGPKLRHPILFNWALLNSRVPRVENSLNPNTIGEARREANQAIQGMVRGLISPGCEGRRAYKTMASCIGPNPDDLIKGLGCKAEALTYNLSHKINRAARRCVTLLVTRRWATNDRLGNIRGTEQTCRACDKGKENTMHIFKECGVIRKALEDMKRAGSRCGAEVWPNPEGLLGLGTEMLDKSGVAIRATALELIRDALASNNRHALAEDVVASSFIAKLKKRGLIKKRKAKPDKPEAQKEDHPPPTDRWGFQAWYDGSGRIAPLQGGAGYCILKGLEEVGCGTCTIPFGTNNIGEFQGALGAVILAKSHTKRAQIIGDCEILTKAMNEGKPVDDPALNSILEEIREECKAFEKISFHHVSRKYNKRADALATAASISVLAGRRAMEDKLWDPRNSDEYKQDRIELVHSSTRFKKLMNGSHLDESFPITSGTRPRNRHPRTVQEDWRIFPSHKRSKGKVMRKVRTGANLRLQAVVNPERPLISGFDWDRYKGFKAMSIALGIKKRVVSISNKAQGLCRGSLERRVLPSPPPQKARKPSHKSKFQGEWIHQEGRASNPRRKSDTVFVQTDCSPLPRISSFPITQKWNINPGKVQNTSRRRNSTIIIESTSPPMNDSRWKAFREIASAIVKPSAPSRVKGPFLCNTPIRVRELWDRGDAPPPTAPVGETPVTEAEARTQGGRQEESPLRDNRSGLNKAPSALESGYVSPEDQLFDELYESLLPQESREGTPPLTLPPRGGVKCTGANWMKTNRKEQSSLHGYLETAGKKIHQATRVGRSRQSVKKGKVIREGEKKRKDVRDKEGRNKPKEKEEGEKPRTGIRKWFPSVPEGEARGASQAEDNCGAGEVRSTSIRDSIS
jgi:ribonuclease HI